MLTEQEDKQDMVATIGEVKTNSEETFYNGLLHMDKIVLTNQQKLVFVSSVPTLGAV